MVWNPPTPLGRGLSDRALSKLFKGVGGLDPRRSQSRSIAQYGRELLLDFTKNQDGQPRDIAETFIVSDKSTTTQP
jgi:hypothetical protein